MAVATVVGAALWAGSDFRQEVKSAGRGAEDEVTHCSFLLPCYIVCCAFFFLKFTNPYSASLCYLILDIPLNPKYSSHLILISPSPFCMCQVMALQADFWPIIPRQNNV